MKVAFYRSGQCRNDPDALLHTYAEMDNGGMCGSGWNRDDGQRLSIFLGSPGMEGDCRSCRKNVAAGKPPMSEGWPHKTKWL